MLQTGIVKVTIRAQEDRFFSIKNVLSIDHPDVFQSSQYLNQLRERQIPLFTASARSPTGKYTRPPPHHLPLADDQPPLHYTDDGQGRPSLGFEKLLRRGESFTFYLIGSVGTTYNYSDPMAETARLNIYTYLTGPRKSSSSTKPPGRPSGRKPISRRKGHRRSTKTSAR